MNRSRAKSSEGAGIEMHPIIQMAGGAMVLVFGAGSVAMIGTSVEVLGEKVSLAPWIAFVGGVIMLYGLKRDTTPQGALHTA